jgi:formaldehyde-activating enzyme involved in methanogenesis
MNSLIPRKRIEQTILVIRGHRVMLDTDLAELYGVETKAFNRAVTRNMERFPDDFMFTLTKNEYEDLRCHFGTSRWGGRRVAW